jgi:hypothetical protein
MDQMRPAKNDVPDCAIVRPLGGFDVGLRLDSGRCTDATRLIQINENLAREEAAYERRLSLPLRLGPVERRAALILASVFREGRGGAK